MATVDDLLAYVNANLPLRPALLTVTFTGYDGNPNDGAAPAILQVAPVGVQYLRETNLQLYEKLSAGATTWTKVGGAPAATEEDLTIPVDYASSVDPTPDQIFSTQQDVDDALGAASGFKHLNKVFGALPANIDHAVAIDVAAGVHRPEVGDAIAWIFDRTIRLGSVTVSGPSQALWPVLVASKSITGRQLGSNDPYLDCAAASFPNDGSLKGRHARLSTGQTVLIHDHTDSRLYVMQVLSPDPTGGTVEVVEPAAELRNSLDDINASATLGTLQVYGEKQQVNAVTFSNLLVDGFAGALLSSHFLASSCFVVYQSCQLRLFDGLALSALESAYLSLIDTSVVGDSEVSGTGTTDQIIWVKDGSTIALYPAYLLGGEDNANVETGAELLIYGAVLDEVGNSENPELASVLVRYGSRLISGEIGENKRNEIRNSPIGGIYCETGSAIEQLFGTHLIVKGCTKACVVFGTHGAYRGTVNPIAGVGILDGGGNLDVGIEFAGQLSAVDLDPDTNVTGANGDVRMADGSILSYSDIQTLGPYFDPSGNTIRKT